jgi:hypothetical protein
MTVIDLVSCTEVLTRMTSLATWQLDGHADDCPPPPPHPANPPPLLRELISFWRTTTSSDKVVI